MNIQELTNKVKAIKARSAWDAGVKNYALWMLSHVEDEVKKKNIDQITLGDLVNHVGYTSIKIGCFRHNAYDAAKETSEGGVFYIYDKSIANALCTKSELKKCTRKDGSLRNPNPRERWIDCQTRAVYQALLLVQDCAARVTYERI